MPRASWGGKDSVRPAPAHAWAGSGLSNGVDALLEHVVRRRVLVDGEYHRALRRVPSDRVEVAPALRPRGYVVQVVARHEHLLRGFSRAGRDRRDPRREELVEREARAVVGHEQVAELIGR